MDLDLGSEDGEEDVDMDLDLDSEEDGETNIKAIQKLTGKLGQKLRDLKDEMEGDDIKYVINSIISAVNLEKLSEEDVEDILGKFEDEEIDYAEEGEYELDSDGDEEFDMGDDEEMEIDLEMGESEHADPIDEFWGGIAKSAVSGAAGAAMDSMLKSESSVDRTISKYFKESKSEEISKKQLIESFIGKKITNNVENKKVSKYYLSYEQEVTSTKLMEKYNVKFKGRNKQGDLLFMNENVKVGVTKGGKIIK